MNRCATCRYFLPFPKDERWAIAYYFAGTCGLAEMNGDVSYYPDPNDPEAEPMDAEAEREAKKMAVSLDGSNYRASLLVKPEFGCTEWAASEAPKP